MSKSQQTRPQASRASKKPGNGIQRAAAEAVGEKPKKAPKAASPSKSAADAKVAEAAVNKGKSPAAGKAPGGITWVEWFKAGVRRGSDPKDLEAEYIELRKDEPAYKDNEKGLKRHAYHHRKLALGKEGE